LIDGKRVLRAHNIASIFETVPPGFVSPSAFLIYLLFIYSFCYQKNIWRKKYLISI